AQKRHITDGEELWYLDETPLNRMVLALKSGIDEEVSWALYRLSSVSHAHGPRFFLRAMLGLSDGLFEWPLWWVRENGGIGKLTGRADPQELWSIPKDIKIKRKHALESLLILRNASLNETNAQTLIADRRTMVLLGGIESLPKTEGNTEFISHCIEIVNALASLTVLPFPVAKANKPSVPYKTIVEIAASSNDRNLALNSMTAVVSLLSNPQNSRHVSASSPIISTAIKYLPLTMDRPLLAAALDCLFTHLSHLPVLKEFLHHPEMANTVKLLVALITTEQRQTPKTIQIAPPVQTAPEMPIIPLYQLSQEELQVLINTPEPQRSLEWMGKMFLEAPGHDETQVNFWSLYREIFTPFAEQCVGGLANAADVIKKIVVKFPQSAAVVDPGPPQRFIIKNVRRREQDGIYRCRWNKGQCSADIFGSALDLHVHLLGHMAESDLLACQWATCTHQTLEPGALRSHVLTHIPSPAFRMKHPSQPPTITLPDKPYPHPSPQPTMRRPPPPPTNLLTYEVPIPDPPSTSLTALLILRLLFRASYPDSGPAPPENDENRFGFPMLHLEPHANKDSANARHALQGVMIPLDDSDETKRKEREGEALGKKAFEMVSSHLTKVEMADEALASWIEEMVDAVNPATT
ncbi:Chromatin structure-remodeling complex protein rsc9, partial [Tulasnella sp. 418]